ncbi:MAG: hypothetical protein ACI4KR_02850, partial [Ruminiclostridium sp.]
MKLRKFLGAFAASICLIISGCGSQTSPPAAEPSATAEQTQTETTAEQTTAETTAEQTTAETTAKQTTAETTA